jgi:AcrR family transcriptional regulator
MMAALRARAGPDRAPWKLFGFHAGAVATRVAIAGNWLRHDVLRDMDCRSHAAVESVVSMTKATARGKYDRSLTTEQRSGERMEKLLDVATSVFAQRGYAGTRVDDIVEATGMSRRTLYQLFDSVDAILTEVYDRAVRISLTMLIGRLGSVTEPIARIHAGVQAWFDLIAENPAAAIVVFDVYRHAGPAQAAKYELNTGRYAMLMLEAVNAAFAAGKVGRAPDEASVYVLVKGIEALCVRSLHRGEQAQLPSQAPQMAKLIIEAFR